MIKVVLFDFGGVLSETGRSGFMRQMFGEVYGVKPADIDVGHFHHQARRGQADEAHIFDDLNARLGKHVTKRQFVEHVQHEYVPARPIWELAQQLRKHHIRTGILSNVFAMNAEELRHQGLYEDFDPVVLSCSTGYAKPDKQFYEIAVKQSGVQPSEILFIDDQQKCTEPAARMGMHTILATNSQQTADAARVLIHKLNSIDL